MYCPLCGTQNETKPSYCRKCGQRLTSVHLVLDGSVDELQEKFRKAEDVLAVGLITFLIFINLAIVSLFIGGGAVPFVFSTLLGFVICLPIVFTGLRRVDRLRRLVDPLEEAKKVALKQAAHPVAELPPVRVTDPLDTSFQMASSVTEHTTFRLKRPDQDV